MGLDTIAKNIFRFYRESLDDVESLATNGIKAGPLRRMVEGHYFEMSWELHYFLWNHTLPGAVRTVDVTIAADNEGGIHIRRHTTEGWSVWMQATYPTSEMSVLSYYDGRPVFRG